MPHSDLDYYKILGVTRHATDDEIKRAFRKLARDTHPDKNPNDPTAKDRFQELQRAYDTLKDALERSKYDEDNQTHGYHGSAGPYQTAPGTARAKSSTAKRYAATGTSSHVPSWATGGASYTTAWGERGTAGARARATADYADPYGPRRAHRGSYAYAEYEDMYTAGYATPKRESAFARTAASRGSATAPRPKSTTGQHSSSTSARYASASASNATPAQGPEFDLGSYIREKQKAQKEAEERAAREKGPRERERERERDSSSVKEERRRRDKEEEMRRAREETRRAQEEGSGRGRYGTADEYYGGYGAPPGDFPQDEEELMKEAEERMKDTQEFRKARQSTSYPSSTSKKKPSAKPTSSSTWQGYKHDDDVHVYEANPDEDSDNDKSDSAASRKDYFDLPRQYSSSNGQRVWNSYYDFGNARGTERCKEKVHSSNSNRKKDQSPVRSYPGAQSSTPPESPTSAARKRRPSPKRTKSSGGGSKKSTENNVKFSTDPFTYQEPPTDSEGMQNSKGANDFPTFKFPEFHTTGTSRNFFGNGTYTSANSPEPGKQASDSGNHKPPERPKSQPSVASPRDSYPFNFTIPLGSSPPKAASTGPPRGVKKELYENLLNTPAPFQFQASDTATSPKKKRSVPGIVKSKGRRDRRASLDATYRNAQVDSDTDEDLPNPPRPYSAAPGVSNLNGPPPALRPGQPSIIPDLGSPEPMDTTPDFTVPSEPTKTNLATPFTNGTKPKFGSNIDLSSLASSLAPEPGLAGFANDLKSTLPFESQAASKPPLHRSSSSTSSRGRMPPPPVPSHSKPSAAASSFWEQYPATPSEEPFIVPPTPPRLVKIPNTTALEAYNKTYTALGNYFAEWHAYESRVIQMRAQLRDHHPIQLQKAKKDGEDGKSENWLSPNVEDIQRYLSRVKDKDMVLDETYRKARKEHVKCLQSWLTLREQVCSTKGSAGVAGGGYPVPPGYR